ncbi:hypothetical protein [uncultured Amnibacterium sp.]|uniref:hypothetical protein n=1 Tax=uncultured Amnibacterium sp. TaxID=1631851 RepID=UPI0035CA1E2D
MDPQARVLDCPLCGTPILLLRDDAIADCPMCSAVGVPLPGVLDPVTPISVGRRH